MTRRRPGVQLSIPGDTDVEMETIPGCCGATVVVLITPTTRGAQVMAPPAVERSTAEVEGEFVRVTLWVRARKRSE